MFINKFKNLIFYLLIFLPLSIGVSSCYSNKKLSSSSINIQELNSDVISSIEAVAALGQLSPAVEIRQLAAPISQFGSYPRLS